MCLSMCVCVSVCILCAVHHSAKSLSFEAPTYTCKICLHTCMASFIRKCVRPGFQQRLRAKLRKYNNCPMRLSQEMCWVWCVLCGVWCVVCCVWCVVCGKHRLLVVRSTTYVSVYTHIITQRVLITRCTVHGASLQSWSSCCVRHCMCMYVCFNIPSFFGASWSEEACPACVATLQISPSYSTQTSICTSETFICA